MDQIEEEVEYLNQFSVGSVEGVPFTTCKSGSKLIILASNFAQIQQIDADSPIASVDCSTDVGKIAFAVKNKINIFEPIPQVQQQQDSASSSKLDYKWNQIAAISSETSISLISFNLEGTRLISGGQKLQLWVVEPCNKTAWRCVWSCKTASYINFLKFSPDGTLFCSGSKSDKRVKIWYESITNTPLNEPTLTTLSTPNSLSPTGIIENGQVEFGSNYFFKSKFDFSFIYIAHPQPVTGLDWRRTSKYTPRGAVANVLVTSCRDNIARVWVQTLLPDDGIVNFNQLKNTSGGENLMNGAPRVQTQRHRQKLLRRLKRMKAFSQFKKRQALALDHSLDELEKVATAAPQVNGNSNHATNDIVTPNSAIQSNGFITNNSNSNGNSNNAAMSTALSAHDFHTYALCSTVVKPGLHFHLAGIIEMNCEADTQSLAPTKIGDLSRTTNIEQEGECQSTQFVVHWINNKEMHITRSIEFLLHDMLLRILRGNNQASSSTNSPHSAGESCSGSENDTEELDDTITAESSKKLRHKLCRKMNKQRALAASGRREPDDNDTQQSCRTGLYPGGNINGRASPTSLVEEFDKTLEALLRKWQVSADLLFSINKLDGTLTLWEVKYLDGEDTGVFRQVKIDQLSHLKSALPHYDATTMSLNITAYSPSAYLDVKRAYLAVTNSSSHVSGNESNFAVGDQFSPVDVPEILSINTDPFKHGCGSLAEIKDNASSTNDAEPSVFIVTEHLSGILGLWKLDFDSTYPRVQSIDLVARITGLPIDPSWLRDGTLIVEYKPNTSLLVTEWQPDESGSARRNSKPSPSLSKSSHPCPEENKSSLNSHLPSVDEEVSSKLLQAGCAIPEGSHLYDKDSYRASQMASSISLLPQYHLKQLIELLAFGKLQRVKAILNHLVNCLISLESNQNKDTEASNSAPWAHRSRTLSIVASSMPSFCDSLDIDNPSPKIQQQVVEEIELDYVEVTSIRPLPLYSLLEADKEKPHSGHDKSTAHEEFSTGYEIIFRSRQVDETLDEILGQSALETLNKQKELKRLESDASGKGSLTSFNLRKAKLLTRVLTHTHLPGLSNNEQMHLLAVADAVALFDASPEDLNDVHEEDSYGGSGSNNISIISTNIAIDSLDDRGLRFLTAMRQHVYLTRCLPMKQRNELKASGIGNHNLVWAFHSESQDELISLIPCIQRNKPEWSELREFGVGWWVKKLEVLRKIIEKVAQSAYQTKQDPLDAALFYLAMKKKTLVCALLRRVNCDKRLLKLFEQDFNDPVNRKKALKNAYALLGLHRFEHAAAFFILAGSIWGAVEVCINNLHDIQLAMVLIRLHDSDANVPSNLRKLLFTEILGSKKPTEQSVSQSSSSNALRSSIDRRSSTSGPQFSYDPKLAHPDPFLRSMAFWKLSDYLSAVHTLLESDVGQLRHRPSILQTSTQTSNSRRNSDTMNAGTTSDASGHLSSSLKTGGNVSISASVFNFYLFLKDQPLVIKHKQQLLEESEIKKRTSPVEEEQVHCHRARSLSSGELGFDERSLIARSIKQSSTEFEVLNETTRLVEKYSDEAIAEKERRLFFSTASAYLDAGCPLLALEVLCSEDHLNMSKAQRMKFVACLHTLMNELNTLASSGQVSSGTTNPKFGRQFFEWLQRSVDAMEKICSYAGSPPSDVGPQQGSDAGDKSQMYESSSSEHGPPLGKDDQFKQQDEGEDEENCEALGVNDLKWIKNNEPILRAMLTYCNLHSATENSLITVRLELLGLLKKLQVRPGPAMSVQC